MHKLNKSIDGFYQNNIKKQSLQLFSIKQNWHIFLDYDLAKFSSPHQIQINKAEKVLIIKLISTAYASEALYHQDNILSLVNDRFGFKISKLRFIS
ncbi:DciA family protein [Rickettsiales bacterium]|nr:DciA family protein [Rickettsiales bacterium]